MGRWLFAGAVKDESTSDCYAPREFPAVADPRMVQVRWHRVSMNVSWVPHTNCHAAPLPLALQALVQGAANAGLADVTYAGVIHSKDSLYTREFLAGFLAPEHRKVGRPLLWWKAGSRMRASHALAFRDLRQYMAWLRSLGVIASEMEASLLFTLASTYTGAPVSVGKAAGATQVLAGTGTEAHGSHAQPGASGVQLRHV